MMAAPTIETFHCPENLDYELRFSCELWNCKFARECFLDRLPDINARYFALKDKPKTLPKGYKGLPVALRPPCGNCRFYHSTCPFDRRFRDVMTPTDACCVDFELDKKRRFSR